MWHVHYNRHWCGWAQTGTQALPTRKQWRKGKNSLAGAIGLSPANPPRSFLSGACSHREGTRLRAEVSGANPRLWTKGTRISIFSTPSHQGTPHGPQAPGIIGVGAASGSWASAGLGADSLPPRQLAPSRSLEASPHPHFCPRKVRIVGFMLGGGFRPLASHRMARVPQVPLTTLAPTHSQEMLDGYRGHLGSCLPCLQLASF